MTHTESKQIFHVEGMLSMVTRRLRGQAELTLPAIPALAEHYLALLDGHFRSLGRVFSDEELEQMRGMLRGKLDEAFRVSPHSTVLVRYQTDSPPSVGISYAFAAAPSTVADEYALWASTRKPPLFGERPDQKVVHLSQGIAAPEATPCLDIGAGTGRNSLPLARRGHPVDALELTPALADLLERDAQRAQCLVRVRRGSILDPVCELPSAHYGLVIAAELTSHFRSARDLRLLFQRIAQALAPGGTALVQAFLTAEAYQPSELERQLSQVAWSTFFTYRELAEAIVALPLELVSDESVLHYEQMHSPPADWPPTSWYVSWAAGHDVFGNYGATPPANLRWLTYRKLQ